MVREGGHMVKIENIFVGDDHPCFIVAEIGINHNGSLEIAKKMIDLAAESGCGRSILPSLSMAQSVALE